MKTLVIVSIVFGALLPLSVSGTTLKIVGSKLVGGNRYVLYENCGWPQQINSYTNPASLMGCLNLPPGPIPPGYTNVCGWTGVVNPNCRYTECRFADIPGVWVFFVDTPTPSTCNVDRDVAQFQFGLVTPVWCC